MRRRLQSHECWVFVKKIVITPVNGDVVRSSGESVAYWKDVPFAALTHAASASGNWNAITPALHPFAFAWSTHVPSVAGSMNPFVASDAAPGFPRTSLFRSNPFCGICSSADPVNGVPAVVISPVQSSYRFWL